MFKRLIGNAKRWVSRINHLSLHSPIAHKDNGYFKPLSSFQLSNSNKTLLKGFYVLELNLVKPCPRTQTILTSAHSNADPTGQVFVFPLSSKRTTKRVVYFSGFTKDVQWVLSASLDSENVESFKLSKISDYFAKRMMKKKMLNAGYDLSTISHYSLSGLYGKYDLIFSGAYNKVIDYKNWILSYESFSNPLQNHDVKISIIMAVYNPPLQYLVEAIESVLAQSYSNWELCIADDCSSDHVVRNKILEYANNDRRIKYDFRSENGNISAASNSALNLATGDYIALLDHDDTLSPCALNEVAKVIIETDAQIIYSDEDKINESSERFEPHFKSDFNYELLLTHNYISHLGVYKKSLLEKVGGFRLGYEGAQDYDLLLRCIPYTSPQNIQHIPKILYHWRAIEGSTAQCASQKSYTSEAGLKALEDFIPSLNESWQVEHGKLDNTYHVSRPIMGLPKVSIIIPTKDQSGLLKTCIDSVIAKTTYQNYEIVIVDNASIETRSKKYLLELEKKKNIRVLSYPKPFNFSAINNFAVSHCVSSEYVLLLNNDIEVINNGWLEEMLSIAQQEGVGCVGAKLYYSNDLIQHAGVILGIGGVAGHSHKYYSRKDNGYFSRLSLRQDLSAVTAACLLVSKSNYEKVGGLNENDLTIAFNDVDFCLKVRELGLRNVWTPFAELYHYESISRGAEDTPEKVRRFNQEVAYMKNQWGDQLLSDPFYNTNLTLQHEDFSLKAIK